MAHAICTYSLCQLSCSNKDEEKGSGCCAEWMRECLYAQYKISSNVGHDGDVSDVAVTDDEKMDFASKEQLIEGNSADVLEVKPVFVVALIFRNNGLDGEPLSSL